jgi:hypothetical protein
VLSAPAGVGSCVRVGITVLLGLVVLGADNVMKTKKDQQKLHAKRRFAERLNVNLSQFLRESLIHKIHDNQAKLVEKQSNRVKVYEITFTPRQADILGNSTPEPVTINIVYDSIRKNIVTVLFPGNEESYES